MVNYIDIPDLVNDELYIPNDIDIANFVNDNISLNTEKKEIGIIESQQDEPLNTEKYKLKNQLEIGKQLGPLKQLFGSFIMQGDVCLFGGDSGIGKSILMYQLCNNLANGDNTFDLANEGGTHRILYYDFELSLQGLYTRYPNMDEISDNFFVKFGRDIFLEVSDFNYEYIEQDIINFKPTVIVIDNITSLLQVGKAIQQSEEAVRLMRGINNLKSKYSITFVVVTHITKANEGKALHKDMLQGSKQLTNLIDSSIMMGKFNDIRYIKSVKSRNDKEINEVLKLEFCSEGNLQFLDDGWTSEDEILKNTNEPTTDKSKDLTDTALYCYSKDKELSNKSLLEKLEGLGNSLGKSQYIIEKMKKLNIITKQPNGFLKLNINNEPF